jgi:hypothetical protein
VIARRRQAPVRLAALPTLTLPVPAAAQLTDAGTPVQPGLALDFRGRHTTVGADYAGVFDFHRDQTGLNTRDHRAALDFTHQATRRLQVFAYDQALLSPTTVDALEVSATVLRRQTTRMNAFRGGFQALLGRQTTLNAAYVSQWIEFADDASEPVSPIPPSGELLLGGHSHGAHVLDPVAAVVGQRRALRQRSARARRPDAALDLGAHGAGLGDRAPAAVRRVRAARLAGLGAGRRSRPADAGRCPGDGFPDGQGYTMRATR